MIHNLRVVALVPMKAHSERVPEKNVRLFAGRPLFHHILESLEETYAVDEVIVDTDSQRIAKEAEREFSKVRAISRPAKLCGDFVSMNDIIAHDMSVLSSDLYIQTHSTNPLLREKTISDALLEFANSENHDSLFAVNRIQTRLYTAEGQPINHNPEELLRTQDLPPVFEENSCLYIFSRESFEAAGGRRIGLRPLMYETDRLESVDIDDEFSFGLAELLARYARDRRGGGLKV